MTTENACAVGCDVYVGNLPFATTKEELVRLFTPFGEVLNVHMPPATTKGRIQGFGFIKLPDENAADRALMLNGTELGGRILKVAPAVVSM